MTQFRMLGAEEVAVILDCTTGTAEEMFRTNRLPGMKAGRSWRVTEAALFAALDKVCMVNFTKEKPTQGFVGEAVGFEVVVPENERVAANGSRRTRRAPPAI